jgi:hypothetical protein
VRPAEDNKTALKDFGSGDGSNASLMGSRSSTAHTAASLLSSTSSKNSTSNSTAATFADNNSSNKIDATINISDDEWLGGEEPSGFSSKAGGSKLEGVQEIVRALTVEERNQMVAFDTNMPVRHFCAEQVRETE